MNKLLQEQDRKMKCKTQVASSFVTVAAGRHCIQTLHWLCICYWQPKVPMVWTGISETTAKGVVQY